MVIRKLSIIVPAYNEETTQFLILEKIRNVHLIYDIEKEIIIVNAGFLIIIFCRRIDFPINTIKHPPLLIISAPFETAKTTNYNSGFNYRVPLPGSLCFNAEIPCVPYPLTNVVLRGDDFQHGFKVIKATH